MSLAALLPLIGFVFAATASPGGATTLVAASGTRFGYARSIPLMAGICLGMGSLTAAIAGGVGRPIGFAKGFGLVWINPKVWTLGVAAVSAFAGLASSTLGLAMLLAVSIVPLWI